MRGGIRDVLALSDFRRFWLGYSLSQLGTSMQVMAIAWQVYLLTREPFSLGLIGLVQVGPIMVFALLGGVWADSVSRRRLLVLTQSVRLLLSVVLTVITVTGMAQAWMLYAVLFCSAIVSSAGAPAQSAIVPSLVPRHLLSQAISLKNLSYSVAGIVGPALGGLAIAYLGLTAVYAFDAASYLLLIGALLTIRANLDPEPAARSGSVRESLTSLGEGFAFLRQNPVLLHLIILDFIAVLFGEARTMMPIFAKDVLAVGPEGLGLLSAAPAVGAALGAAIMAMVPAPARPGRTVLVTVAIYGVCVAVFGLSTWFPLSWLALAGAGIADTISMTQRQVVPQLLAPDTMRGRVGGINFFFAATGNQLGEFEAGTIAHWTGVRTSVFFGGLACILAAGWYTARERSIWRFAVSKTGEIEAPAT